MCNSDNASGRVEITAVEGLHEAGPWLESAGISTRGEIIAMHGANTPDRTLPRNIVEKKASLYFEMVGGSGRNVITPVQGGVEIFYEGRTYYVPLGQSCVIFPFSFDSADGADEAQEN